MLKFGRIFFPSQVHGLHTKVSAYGVRQGANNPTLNYGVPVYLGNYRARKLKFGKLVGIYEY